MEILRRTLKVYVLALCAFAALSLILAAVIRFTGFPETWTFAGLVAALSLVSLLTGAMEGGIIGKRGMIVGRGGGNPGADNTAAGRWSVRRLFWYGQFQCFLYHTCGFWFVGRGLWGKPQ